MAKPTVYIDGEAGTTGLQIADRLRARDDLQLISIDPDRRKDPAERARLINSADAVVLCLPDDAAREAVSLVESEDTVVVDASTAHRIADGWTYGFAEMSADQRAALATSKRIANPGCYPTGFIALMRPLISAGLVPANHPATVNAVSGYSGGGRGLIEAFESGEAPEAYRAYALKQGHKHLPEMRTYSGLDHAPVFSPSVGRFRQGMIVEVPLALWALSSAPTKAMIQDALRGAYHAEQFVQVVSMDKADALTALEPEALNGTNRMQLFVFGNDEDVRLMARLDNLGKGASGAAVQNLNIALGLDESAGL
ncbi:MAG: N-acetyl-gamma-glutamyl-phosphate reductase [Pseudomonadota bacterium]